MYIYCLLKTCLCVLKASLCIYLVFALFRSYLDFSKSWSGVFCSWLPGNPVFNRTELKLRKILHMWFCISLHASLRWQKLTLNYFDCNTSFLGDLTLDQWRKWWEKGSAPWQANCKNWAPFGWNFAIYRYFCFSVGCYFLRFSGCFRFLASIDIQDIRIQYHFLAFFLSVG